MAEPEKPTSDKPRTVLWPAVSTSPPMPAPAIAEPSISTDGLSWYPGSVVPSIITGTSIAGRGEARWIVRTPAVGMLKSISTRDPAGLEFAWRIAQRKELGFVSSLVLVTTNVDRSQRRSIISQISRRATPRPRRIRHPDPRSMPIVVMLALDALVQSTAHPALSLQFVQPYRHDSNPTRATAVVFEVRETNGSVRTGRRLGLLFQTRSLDPGALALPVATTPAIPYR